MAIENILLIGGKDWAKFDQLRELGCRVSRAESISDATEKLTGCELVVVEARALQDGWADVSAANAALFVSGDRQALEGISKRAFGCISGFVSQTPGRSELAIMLQSAWAQRRLAVLNSRNTSAMSNAELIGSTGGTTTLRETIRKIARTNATVLIQGEPGTGKGAVAVELHRQSARGAKSLSSVDCATLDADAGELFGSEAKGVGLLELADGGTLVLEEVNTLSAAAQERLLQFLQEGTFHRLGAVRSDVRIVATASVDLAANCKRGAFREDLFLRLNIAPVHLVPLRERREDIGELSEHFRQQLSARYGSNVVAFSPTALKALNDYAWPGNIAELEHVIGRAVIIAAGKTVIEPEHLHIEGGFAPTVRVDENGPVQTLDEVERRHIFYVLEQCQWNRTHAAVKLGISIRTLRNKLREYRTAAADNTPQQEAA